MPKDKDYGITMKEAEDRTKDLATAADPTMEGEKAEPQDETQIMCYYWEPIPGCPCPGAMGDERHYVIKNGEMVMAHKQCHKRDQDGEKKTPNVIIR